MNKYNSKKAIATFNGLSQKEKNRFKKDADEYIEKIILENELIRHILKSRSFMNLLQKEFDKFFRNYSEIVKYPELLTDRKDDLREVFNKLLVKRVVSSTGFISQLSQFYIANDKKFNKIQSDIANDYFKPIVKEIFLIPNFFVSVLLLNDIKWDQKIKHLEREKDLIHNELDKENFKDKRIPKKKCEDYITEVLQPGDKNLKREELATEVRERIIKKYPAKRFSVTTIRPKLTYLPLP